jgi:RNA polymerase sigma factor (TIGR02999 family)
MPRGAGLQQPKRRNEPDPASLAAAGGAAQNPVSNRQPTRMTAAPPSDITELLADARAGDTAAWESVVAAIYTDLRRIARGHLAARGPEYTLDTTGLVHECYLRIARGATPNDRNHFMSLAARVMRQVIIDHARERIALKRGSGSTAVPLDQISEAEIEQAQQFVALDDALTALAQEHPQYARIVECRFFAGLTEPEAAATLGLSLRIVQRDWHLARQWLAQFLGE